MKKFFAFLPLLVIIAACSDDVVNQLQENPDHVVLDAVEGCSNTAVAMALFYFEYPKRMNLTYEAGLVPLDIDWGKLKLHNAMGEEYKSVNEWNCNRGYAHKSLAYLS